MSDEPKEGHHEILGLGDLSISKTVFFFEFLRGDNVKIHANEIWANKQFNALIPSNVITIQKKKKNPNNAIRDT